MDDPSQTWSVIKFPDEEAVSAVPSSWIVDGNKCYWPPYSSKLVRTAIEKNEMPDAEKWQLFSCIGFRNNVYDTFKEANRKSILATKTSDLESGSEMQSHSAVSSKNRKIFRKTYSFSSVEEEDESILPNPPQYKKSKVSENLMESENSGVRRSIPKSGTTTSRIMIESNMSPQRTFPQLATSTSRNNNDPDNDQESDSKKIIRYLENLIRKQNILQSTMLDICNRITNLENNRAVVSQVDDIESIFIVVENLPANTSEDLEALEIFLGNEMNNAVKEISKLGGATIYDFIVRATQKLITNNLCGREYSYEGKRQKNSFRNLKLNELLTKSSMLLFKNVTVKEVELNIQKWIRRCSERAKAKIRN